jgi:hypothetical protein
VKKVSFCLFLLISNLFFFFFFEVICPKQDSPFCSQALFQDKCWLYPVVRASCPYMCQLCKKDDQFLNSTTTKSMIIKPTTNIQP